MGGSDKNGLEGVRPNTFFKNEPIEKSIKDLLTLSSERLAEIILKIDKSKN